VGAFGHLALTEDDLSHSRRVTKVDEDDPTVITPTGDPTAQGDGLASVFGAKRPGLVRADHGVLSPVGFSMETREG